MEPSAEAGGFFFGRRVKNGFPPLRCLHIPSGTPSLARSGGEGWGGGTLVAEQRAGEGVAGVASQPAPILTFPRRRGKGPSDAVAGKAHSLPCARSARGKGTLEAEQWVGDKGTLETE